MNIREAALRLLTEWENDGKYINLSMNSHFLDALSHSERASLTALVYTAVEHKITYDYYISALSRRQIDKISPNVVNILRIGLCQILDMNSIPDYAAVNESVKLARHGGERVFINGVLRAAVRAKEEGELPMPPYEKNPARHFSVKYSLPLWMVRRLISKLGEDRAVSLFESFNTVPTLDVVVNTLKISRDELFTRLCRDGIEVKKSERTALTLKINSHASPRELSGFDDGLFFVQDEASTLSVIALDPKPGERVIDVCSAPGGKSLVSAILMGDIGEICSFDVRESKISLISSSAERLGIKIIKTAVADASVLNEELVGAFDKLICDAPCSGIGVIRKKPDLRYKSENSIADLPSLQLSIIQNASKYIKAGGEMVYSTCTLLREENEEVVEKFLDANPEFSPADFEIGELVSSNGCLTLYPNEHKTDGFFIAKLRKNK